MDFEITSRFGYKSQQLSEVQKFSCPKIPEMAPLPDAIFAVHMRPFTYSGIDYFGPIKVVFGRGTAKRWGVMITCLTTRVVHLEIAHSLDTSSCMMAIYNFIGRFLF